MDARRDIKSPVSQHTGDSDLNLKKEKEVYDVIQSDELDLLYKKNAHLLDRLSKTGKENTLLYTKLSSLSREKSSLGNKNIVLTHKFLDLKGQISKFARQHRHFNREASQLKEELKKFQELKTTEADESVKPSNEPDKTAKPSHLEKEIRFSKKKEQVYQKQIQTLQDMYEKKESEKQEELESLKKEHQINTRSLEDKLQQFYQLLSEERNKTALHRPGRIEKVKKVNKNLNQKIKTLEERIKDVHDSYQQALEKNKEIADEKNQIQETLKKRADDSVLMNHLKLECENLKKALTTGKLGFDQAMLSFQRKYMKLYKDWEELKKQEGEKAEQIQSLRDRINQLNQLHFKEKEESENKIRKQKDTYINELSGELKAFKEQNRELESQLQSLRMESHTSYLREKQQIREEVRNLKWQKSHELARMAENYKKEVEEIKSEHEKRMKNMESAFQGKLQHIRVEMENDLCSEKKRHEIFKDMKTRQIREMENSLSFLQAEQNEIKAQKFILKKSLEETREKMDWYLKSSKKWEERSESLKALWQELQKQNETKDQQIRALQKLNKSLSTSLNTKKKPVFEKKPSASPSFLDEEKSEGEKESLNQVLAEIHFD